MRQNGKESPSITGAVENIELCRIAPGTVEEVCDKVIAERALTIMVEKVGSFTIMCTPSDIEALAVGFVFAEGMIDDIDDVVAVSIKENVPDVVGITIHDPSRIAIARNLIIASSCGMCGLRNIEKLLSEMPKCANCLQVSSSILIEVCEKLRSAQQIFKITGSSHAAAIFTADGQIITFAEDIGRHNALDKAIGKCLLARKQMRGCGVALSGRVSLEMVTKAAKAGIELIAAVSAASSFAIEAAKQWNITLCGFVRPEKANVYSHFKRVKDCDERRM